MRLGGDKMVDVVVGKEAPDFMLPDTARRPRKLSEFKGRKLVLVFFSRSLHISVHQRDVRVQGFRGKAEQS